MYFPSPKLVELAANTLAASAEKNWRDMLVQESGEEMLLVPPEMCFPYYSRVMAIGHQTKIYVRRQVLSKILHASQILQEQGYTLMIYDGWRSLEVQEELFWYYLRLFSAEKYGLGKEFNACQTVEETRNLFDTLTQELQSALTQTTLPFASLPSKEMGTTSPHATGGGIDVWLWKDGKPVTLGVPFDWMEEEAGAFYHLLPNRHRFEDDETVCFNRQTLLLAMSDAGFSCYPAEIWHYNFGNQMDSVVRGIPAIYSYAEPY